MITLSHTEAAQALWDYSDPLDFCRIAAEDLGIKENPEQHKTLQTTVLTALLVLLLGTSCLRQKLCCSGTTKPLYEVQAVYLK